MMTQEQAEQPQNTPTTTPQAEAVITNETSGQSSYFSRLFKGRLNRLSFFAASFLLSIPYVVIYTLVFSTLNNSSFKIIALPILYIILLVFTVYGVSFSIRRLHDSGKSGWLILLGLIPFVGGLIMIFLVWIVKGEDQDNKYGSKPLKGAHVKQAFGLD